MKKMITLLTALLLIIGITSCDMLTGSSDSDNSDAGTTAPGTDTPETPEPATPGFIGTWYLSGDGWMQKTTYTETDHKTWEWDGTEWDLLMIGNITESDENSINADVTYIYDTAGTEYDKTAAEASSLNASHFGGSTSNDWDGVFGNWDMTYTTAEDTIIFTVDSEEWLYYSINPTIPGDIRGHWKLLNVDTPSGNIDETLTISEIGFSAIMYSAGTTSSIGNFGGTVTSGLDLDNLGGRDSITITITESNNGPSVGDTQLFRIEHLTDEILTIDVSYDDGTTFEYTGLRCFRQELAGSGTAEDPYYIYTIENLQTMENHLDSHYDLVMDLDFDNADSYLSGIIDTTQTTGEGFLPFDTFRGIFDGKDHIISNLYINRPDDDQVGLFRKTSGSNIEIKNLNLQNCHITGADQVGSLVGEVFEGLIENCSATGTVIGDASVGYSWNIGGLVGRAKSDNEASRIYINNSYSECSVEGDCNVGGFIGTAGNVDLEGCYATGNVTQSGSAVHAGAGGLIGSSGNAGLTASEDSLGSVTIDRCYATGDIVNDGENTGGLIGITGETEISNSYSTGDVSGSGSNQSGLAGQTTRGGDTIITNCYASGDIFTAYAGGLVNCSIQQWESYPPVGYTLSLSNSIAFNSSIPNGDRITGSLNPTNSTISLANCYANADMTINGSTTSSSDPTSYDGADMTSVEFIDLDSYNNDGTAPSLNWDFSTVWEIQAGAIRPTLIDVGNDSGQ